MKIIQYSIAIADSRSKLCRDVERGLILGWQPIGGVTFDGHNYFQAVVKYEDTTP